MPRQDTIQCIIDMNCDFCGNHVRLDSQSTNEEVDAAMNAWTAVLDAKDAPNKQQDMHRWYDTLECQFAGESKYRGERDAAASKQAAQDQAIATANEALKAKGFMKPQLVT